jgi:UTP--glucose-1-phosphate uridylyltransferase
MANIHFVWQKELRGLGDAVLHAREHVGQEPFAVLLGDTIIESKTPVTRQLIEVYNRYQEPVVALEEVEMSRVSRYGVINGKPINGGQYLISDFVEKPAPSKAPSNLAIAGRYVFTAEVFEHLRHTKPGKNGEIQLTDAMRLMAAKRAMYGLRFDGRRHDIGNKVDFIKTNILFGLQREDMRKDLAAFVKAVAREL